MPGGAIRILHLHGRPPDFQTARAAGGLRRDCGTDFDVSTHSIGPGGAYRNLLTAVLALRARPAGRFDVVHAWDETALTAAAVAGAGPVLYTPMRPLGRRSIGWLRAVQGYRDVHVVLPTATQRRLCVERGVPLDRCHLVRPGVEFA